MTARRATRPRSAAKRSVTPSAKAAVVAAKPKAGSPEAKYGGLVSKLIGERGVTMSGKGFGSEALRVNNKIFAMLTNGRLVVKLPRERVDALIASKDGERFDPGHGRLMKEWLSVSPRSAKPWLSLAREALAFGASKK
jgi:hypothetical protein